MIFSCSTAASVDKLYELFQPGAAVSFISFIVAETALWWQSGKALK